jgi:gluconolactonase
MELQNVRVFAEGLNFPEGPVAMPDGTVIAVEIKGGRVLRCHPGGQSEVIADLGGGPNGAAIGPDGALYVCNNGGRRSISRHTPSIQRVDLKTGVAHVLYSEANGVALQSPNDIVFDKSGNFYFTDIRLGAIFYASPDGRNVKAVVEDASAPNGVGLSEDETVLYWAQTHLRQVIRRRISAPGVLEPSAGASVLKFTLSGEVDSWSVLAGLPGYRELDSLAVDSSGAVCVGALVDPGIVVVPVDGSPVEVWTLPEEFGEGAITNICFGGPDLTTAYITASMTGRILTFPWPRPGLLLNFQELPSASLVAPSL